MLDFKSQEFKRVSRRVGVGTVLFLSGISFFRAEMARGQSEGENATVIEEKSSFDPNTNTINIEKLGLSLTPPAGWEVKEDMGGLTLFIEEPKKEVKNFSKPIFQRNITLATIHEAAPIDEIRAQELRKQLEEKFSKDASVKNFQVLEHRFIDHKDKNDGLIIYTSYTTGEFDMMQMHLLISGEEKQFLTTYTDLASDFGKNDSGAYNEAWKSMTSIQVKGESPKRYFQLVRYGVLGLGGLVFLCLLWFLRRRANNIDYVKESDVIYRDDHDMDRAEKVSQVHTLATAVWNLKSFQAKKLSEKEITNYLRDEEGWNLDFNSEFPATNTNTKNYKDKSIAAETQLVSNYY